MYKVLSISTPSQVLLLEEQLRNYPERCDKVNAAWWSYGFAAASTRLGEKHQDHLPAERLCEDLPRFQHIEHVAWFLPRSAVRAAQLLGPTGFHYAVRDAGAWSADMDLSHEVRDVMSETPRLEELARS